MLVDARPLDEMQGVRETTKTGETVEYGDDQIVPPKLQVLRSRLEQGAGDRLANQTVTVKKFRVYAMRFFPDLSGRGPVNVPSSGSAGADTLGALLGGLIIQAVEDARTPRSVGVELEIDVGGRKIEAEARESASSSDLEQKIQQALVKAIGNLVENIVNPAPTPAAAPVQEATIAPAGEPASVSTDNPAPEAKP